MATANDMWTSQQRRDRAEEARARAEELRDKDAKAMMLRIAELYESMAERIERREREGWSPVPMGSGRRAQ